ncbi:MAG: hypothetical protein P8J20_06470 [Novosphingobium sp.]|nr:hypothetical protein [Novosphingobium sp.]
MTQDDSSETREERLAAKLRENLRRRKARARVQAGEEHREDGTEQSRDDPLSNLPPKS